MSLLLLFNWGRAAVEDPEQPSDPGAGGIAPWPRDVVAFGRSRTPENRAIVASAQSVGALSQAMKVQPARTAQATVTGGDDVSVRGVPTDVDSEDDLVVIAMVIAHLLG